MATDDGDNLGHSLTPSERKMRTWLQNHPDEPFSYEDVMNIIGKCTSGTARNIILRLKRLKLIKLYCRDKVAFYISALSDLEKVKPVTVSRMEGSGLRRAQINFVALLESIPWEELCKIHEVHLNFPVEGLYELFVMKNTYHLEPISKDVLFGSFNWSKYRSLRIVLHRTGTVSFYLSCSNCPIESSAVGFMCMAAFLGGVRKELLNTAKACNSTLNEESLPKVEEWRVAQWHYGRDSAQEFSGERFNITFKMWCGILARIYVHQQDRMQKLRIEVIQSPNKTLRQAAAEKLNLCCSRCNGCSKQS